MAPTRKTRPGASGQSLGGANARQVGGLHYRSAIQHWDFVIANDIPYLEAQVIKYVCRWRKKNGLADLEKAQHFLQKLIEVNKKPPHRK